MATIVPPTLFDAQLVADLLKADSDQRAEESNLKLKHALSSLAMFRACSDVQQNTFCRAAQFERIPAGKVLWNESSPFDQPLRIVLSGCVELIVRGATGKTASTLLRGQFFGDSITLHALPRGAIYVATEVTECLAVGYAQYERVAKRAIEDAEVSRRISAFQKLVVPIFYGWARSQLDMLARLVFVRHFDSKKVIVREKEVGDCMFFILSGECKVVREVDFADGSPFGRSVKLLELATLLPGEYFGEMALLHKIVDKNEKAKPLGKGEIEQKLRIQRRKLKVLSRTEDEGALQSLDIVDGKKKAVTFGSEKQQETAVNSARPGEHIVNPPPAKAAHQSNTSITNIQLHKLAKNMRATTKAIPSNNDVKKAQLTPRPPRIAPPQENERPIPETARKPKEDKHPTSQIAPRKTAQGGQPSTEFTEQSDDDDSSSIDSDSSVTRLRAASAFGLRQATVYSHTPVDVLVLTRSVLWELSDISLVVQRLRHYAKGYPTKVEIRNQFAQSKQWENFKRGLIKTIVSDRE